MNLLNFQKMMAYIFLFLIGLFGKLFYELLDVFLKSNPVAFLIIVFFTCIFALKK